jgi:hypothetical protein
MLAAPTRQFSMRLSRAGGGGRGSKPQPTGTRAYKTASGASSIGTTWNRCLPRFVPSVPNLKFVMVGELQIRNTSSMFSVACWSQKPAARCDELLGQDTSADASRSDRIHADGSEANRHRAQTPICSPDHLRVRRASAFIRAGILSCFAADRRTQLIWRRNAARPGATVRRKMM